MILSSGKTVLHDTSMTIPAPSATVVRRILTAFVVGFILSLGLVWNAQSPRLHPVVWRPPEEPEQSLAVSAPEAYFEQVLSLDDPAPYDFDGLRDACDDNDDAWRKDIYLNCVGIGMGLTTIISQVKVCIKMAIDARVNLILPDISRRDDDDLWNYHLKDGRLPFDEWFDIHHFRRHMGESCPKMHIIDAADANNSEVISMDKEIDISFQDMPGYTKYRSYFWVGRPFKTYFDSQVEQLGGKMLEQQEGDDGNDEVKDLRSTHTGVTVVNVEPELLLFRITADPTRGELRLWNDLSHLLRFGARERHVAHWVLGRLVAAAPDAPAHYGVHFRVENDTIWTSFENQLAANLDALDRAWQREQHLLAEPPVVYVACGDWAQAERFRDAVEAHGWQVWHKWRLAGDDPAMLDAIEALPFDLQGAVDLAVMLRSRFFFGITGSAFSSTVANHRDSTGRYRGSSLDLRDDGGARNHLLNDLESIFPCCL